MTSNENQLNYSSISKPESTDDNSVNGNVANFRALYEREADKRKILGKVSHKAKRDYNDLEIRYKESNKIIDDLQVKLKDSETQLRKLQNVSEAVYHEYDDLKTRYDVEHETMSKAFSRATEWYKENKSLRHETAVLRRQSAMFLQKLPEEEIDYELDFSKLDKMEDEKSKDSNDDHYLEELLQKIKDLEREVLRLNADLTKAKEYEMEAQEKSVDLRRQLETTKCKVVELKEKLEMEENDGKTSKLVLEEIIVEVEDFRKKIKLGESKAETTNLETTEVHRNHAVLSRKNAIIRPVFTREDRYRKVLKDFQQLTALVLKPNEYNVQQIQTVEENGNCQNNVGENESRLFKGEFMLLDEDICYVKKSENKPEEKPYDFQKEAPREDLKEDADSLVNGETSDSFHNIPRIPIPPPVNLLPRKRPPPPPPRIPISLEEKTLQNIPPPPPLPQLSSTIPPHPLPELSSTIPPPPPPPPPVIQPTAVNIFRKIKSVTKEKLPESDPPKPLAMDDLIDQIKRGGIQLKKTPKRGFFRKIHPSGSTPTLQDPISEMKNILATRNKARSNIVVPKMQSLPINSASNITNRKCYLTPYKNSHTPGNAVDSHSASPIMPTKVHSSHSASPIMRTKVPSSADLDRLKDNDDKTDHIVPSCNMKTDTIACSPLNIAKKSSNVSNTNSSSSSSAELDNVMSSTTFYLGTPNCDDTQSSKIY